MANPRVPKLDPVWMTALGFVLNDRPNVAYLFWRNEPMDIMVSDHSASAEFVVAQVIRKAGQAALRQQAIELRNVLLPALGLEEKSEYDAGGYTKRTFISPEY